MVSGLQIVGRMRMSEGAERVIAPGGIFVRKSLGILSSFTGLSFPLEIREVGSIIMWFHNGFLTSFLSGILVLVLGIFIRIVLVKFFRLELKERIILETFWIVCPLFILALIVLPSITLLYLLEDAENNWLKKQITKIVGLQWYWNYTTLSGEREDIYLERGEEVDSLPNLSNRQRLEISQNRLLLGLTTANDVMHRWTLPAFFIKRDAIPGRLNQFSIFIPRTPRVSFMGQCSELCGANHSFMPIHTLVV